jgi:tetratricopeptide (TPR) repeat protein
MNDLLNEAIENFSNENYKRALHLYALVLEEDVANKEAKIGAILCDMAMDGYKEAYALFDYFLILKKEGSDAEGIVENILKTLDGTSDNFSAIVSDILSTTIESEDGITYFDFENIVKERGSFKRAFQDIMFSTKILITSEEDLAKFLKDLVDNGFNSMALSYFEYGAKLFRLDENTKKILEKIEPDNR